MTRSDNPPSPQSGRPASRPRRASRPPASRLGASQPGASRPVGAFRRSVLHATDGCGFLVFTCLVSCLLMIINGGFVAASYQWLAAWGPEFLQQSRVAQATLFVAPVLLLFVEWWLLDHLLEFLRPQRRP